MGHWNRQWLGTVNFEGRARTDTFPSAEDTTECDRQNANYARQVQMHLHHGNAISAGVAGTDGSEWIV